MPGWANSLALAEALRIFACRLFPHSAWQYSGASKTPNLVQAVRMFPCRLLPYRVGP